MPTTARGIYYPASTNAPRVWEDMAALAESADDAFDAIQPAGKAAQLIAGTSTTSTSPVALMTLSSVVFKSGWAYEISFGGNFGTSAADRASAFRLYKTSTAGTDYGEYGRYYCGVGVVATSGSYRWDGRTILRRTAGTDLTTDVVLAWATVASTTLTLYAGSTFPLIFAINPIGLAAQYPAGIDVT